MQLTPSADAYVVVYSVADRESFDEAIEVLHEIAKDKKRSPPAVILVANKGDIVRNRTVTEDGEWVGGWVSEWVSEWMGVCKGE